MSIRCLLRGVLLSLPTLSRNIKVGNTAITEIGFTPGPGGSQAGSSSTQAGAGTKTNGSSGGHRQGGGPAAPLPPGSWHLLRVNDESHLPYDLRS